MSDKYNRRNGIIEDNNNYMFVIYFVLVIFEFK